MPRKQPGPAGKAPGSKTKPKKLRKDRPLLPMAAPAPAEAAPVGETRPVPSRVARTPLRRPPAAPALVVDYHYVLADLRRIGLTSAAIVAILVVLAVLLR